MKTYLGAIDQGTTSTRFIVFDKAGRIISAAQKEHEQIFPQPGWVEHNPEEIWQLTREVIAEALAKGKLTSEDLAAIGITNQRETIVVWEKSTGKAVMNAIVWQDTRVSPDVAHFSAQGGQDRFRAKTGLPLSTYFSGLKLRWILKNVRGAAERAQAGELLFGNIDTFLLWNLTGGPRGGVHATDVTNASRTQLLNLKTLDWDDELLRAFEIPRSVLPHVKSSSEVYGTIADGAVKGVVIAGILGDQQAALVGQACFRPGDVKNTYGTGCFMLMNTGAKAIASKNNLLTTVAWRIGGRTEYALEGSIFIAGAVVQWLRDGLGIIKSSAEIERLAAAAPDNGGVYLVPAFAGLGAPHWDQYARGTITGITRGTSAAHIARATLESIAYQVTDLLRAMEDDAGISLAELRIDGGAIGNNLLMQFQADLLGVPVVRPRIGETTALGAAYLAGLAVGYWRDRNEIASHWQMERVFTPAMERAKADELCRQWQRALERAKGWEENLANG